MVKDRFLDTPFDDLTLTPSDASGLLNIVNSVVDTGFERYENFWTVEKAKVNTDKWKLLKARENTRVFVEQQSERASSRSPSIDSVVAEQQSERASSRSPSIDSVVAEQQSERASSRSPSIDSVVAELPSLLSVGTTSGALDDVMLGVINPTLESMRVKASYVKDLSAAAVLSNLVMPSTKDPFRSVVVKWMELDIPFQSAGLVKNRDYVYVEATGMTETFDGERVGFHVLHSVNFPQTSSLPNRVRANISICCFFRQVRPNVVSVYVTGIMDPVGNDRVRRLVVSNMASAFLSTLKYAHCGQMKKLTWALESTYSRLKVVGAPDPDRICVTCRKTVSRRIGDFGNSGDTCKLCFGLVCNSCILQRKISFVGPDLRLDQRKVAFCAVCMHKTVNENACKAARRQIRSDGRASKASRKMSLFSDLSTISSDEPAEDCFSSEPPVVEEPPRLSYGFVIF